MLHKNFIADVMSELEEEVEVCGTRTQRSPERLVLKLLPIQSSQPVFQSPRPLLSGLGKGRALRMPRIQGSLRERLPAPPGARA